MNRPSSRRAKQQVEPDDRGQVRCVRGLFGRAGRPSARGRAPVRDRDCGTARERGGHFAAGGRCPASSAPRRARRPREAAREADGDDRGACAHYQEIACPNPAARARVDDQLRGDDVLDGHAERLEDRDLFALRRPAPVRQPARRARPRCGRVRSRLRRWESAGRRPPCARPRANRRRRARVRRAPSASRADRDGRRRPRRCARRQRRPHPSITGVRETVASTIDVGAARGGSGCGDRAHGQAGRRRHLARERLAMRGARDSRRGRRVSVPHVTDRLEVAARLHADADDRRARARRAARDACTDTADTAAVRASVMYRPSTMRDERARRVIEQHDGREVRRQAARVVALVDGHELRADRRRIVERRPA